MKSSNHFKLLSFFLIAAALLAACGGTVPPSTASLEKPKGQTNLVAFTGTVESIDGNLWLVSGQQVTLDSQTSRDPNIAVGDTVKVEANVLSDGGVVALKVESSGNDDVVSMPAAGTEATSTPSPDASSSPDVNSSPDAPTSSASQAGIVNEHEIFGIVQSVAANTITVDGVTYNLTNSTEFKNELTVGDQVKLHVIFHADGSMTVREVEKSMGSFDDNGNSAGSDDGPNHDVNDDHSNDDSGPDDHGGDDQDDDNNGGNSGPGGDD